MAARSKKKKVLTRASRDETSAEPKFPYCIAPKSLRRFLEMVPQKPKPPKVTGPTLKVWGLKNNNDQSILRVLKSVELLGPSGETTQTYADFMRKETGPAVLGRKIRLVYSTLFENVANPETASSADLTNFFNIHSGGGERTIRYQIDTFKALAAYATFGDTDPLSVNDAGASNESRDQLVSRRGGEPVVRIDLHIHLPENKTKAEYDALLESIATHIYKRSP